MITKKTIIVTMDEAKEALVQFFADVLADRAAIVENLREGKIPIPHDLDEIVSDPFKIAEQYGELCLGEELLKSNPDADVVFVQTGEWTYEFAADKNQLHPKDK